jgi:peptidoglycan-associated lipoprotein
MDKSARPAIGAVLIATASLALAFALSCGNTPKPPGCKSDKDCTSPLVCGENACVECNENSQCPKGKRCEAHACVAKPQCEKDEQCAPGQVCQAGECRACAADAECGPGGTCEAGSCKRPKKCAKDDECADDEDCTNGLCMKSGANKNADAPCQLQTVYFSFDDSGVQASERDRLDADNACITKNKGKNVLVIGHTDTSGTEEYNIALSERRAQAVADYLARLGADPARLQVVPKGETEPTGQGDQKDRRVEFQFH